MIKGYATSQLGNRWTYPINNNYIMVRILSASTGIQKIAIIQVYGDGDFCPA